jgi:hypothetical protein
MVIGSERIRRPVAWKTALAIAAAVLTILAPVRDGRSTGYAARTINRRRHLVTAIPGNRRN